MNTPAQAYTDLYELISKALPDWHIRHDLIAPDSLVPDPFLRDLWMSFDSKQVDIDTLSKTLHDCFALSGIYALSLLIICESSRRDDAGQTTVRGSLAIKDKEPYLRKRAWIVS